VADNREVVRDEQVSQSELDLEPLQQIDDLGLNRHVQCGDGLIANEKTRFDGQGPRDADALALTA
jgi:hypothetical protein